MLLVLIPLLMLQSSGVVIFTRVSMLQLCKLDPSISVFFCEFFKFLFWSFMHWYWRRRSLSKTSKEDKNLTARHILSKKSIISISVLSGLYVLQNNLHYQSLLYLPSEIYQVLIQMKIIFTSLFTMAILQRKLSFSQWLGILVHVAGIVVVQMSLERHSSNLKPQYLLGTLIVIFSSIVSGLAGVYFELVIKTVEVDFKWYNVISTGISSAFSLIAILVKFGNVAHIIENIMSCSDFVKLLVILLQSSGGILVPLIVRQSNSIVKCFIYSLSIVLTYSISSFVFEDFTLNIQFIYGASIVILSLFLYSSSSLNFNCPWNGLISSFVIDKDSESMSNQFHGQTSETKSKKLI